MTGVMLATGTMLALAALLTLIRIARGPSALDRTVAFDIITSILIMTVALVSIWEDRTDSLPLLAALAMVGFVASVSVARFASIEPEDAKRMRSAEEVAEEEAARIVAEEQEAREAKAIAARRDDEETDL